LLKNIIKQTPFANSLVRGVSGSMAFKLANLLLTLAMAIIFARLLGAKNFGIYAFCISIVQLLTVPATLGGQQLLVRELSAYQEKSEYKSIIGILQTYRRASGLVSIILALLAAGLGYWFYIETSMFVPFILSACLVPLYTQMQLQGAALRGLHHVLWGQAALTLRPGLVIILVGCFYAVAAGVLVHPLNAEVAIGAQLLGSSILAFFTFFLLRRVLLQETQETEPNYEISRWVKSAKPFMLASGMQILNNELSVVLLGILQTPEQVGLFRVAQRGAMLIPFGLQAVNMTIGPTVAQMFAKGEKELLQRIISKGGLFTVAFALPVSLILILGGEWIIPFIFGHEFSDAYLPLVILCVGQLVNAGVGSVALVLNMAGLERLTARAMVISSVSGLVFNAVLIPFWGPVGAALATSISLTIWNVLLVVWLYRQIGVLSIIRLRLK
jgi:O-antigen/teichoic acid export membrane protein